MSETPLYALWVRPNPTTTAPLRQLIETFAARYGGPPFEPHITVASGIEDEPTARRLGREVQIDVMLHRLSRQSFLLDAAEGVSGSPFKALYLRVPRLYWLWLAEARIRPQIKRSLMEYRPHVSLFYGDLSVKKRRAAVALVEATRPISFKAAAVDVWRVDGPVAGWKAVVSLPLVGSV